MKHIKQLAVAATIALAGITGAQAQQIAGSETPITQLNTYGGVTEWTFSSNGTGSQALQLINWSESIDDGFYVFDGGAPSTKKGGTFTDIFMLNVPDNEYVSIAFGPASFLTPPGVSFSAFEVDYAYTGDALYKQTYNNPYNVATDTFALNSGFYELDISGTFLQNGGSFSGVVFGSPVPEPGNWALLMAGLGAVGMLARRRRDTRA